LPSSPNRIEWLRIEETEAFTLSIAVARSSCSEVRAVNHISTASGARPASAAPACTRAIVSRMTSGRSPVPATTPSPMRPPRWSILGPSAQIEIGTRGRTTVDAHRTRCGRPWYVPSPFAMRSRTHAT
jgi:hypothetical protein